MGELVEKRGVQWVPVALELVPGWFQFFGIGHIYQGRAAMGLFIMFSYWGVQALNLMFLTPMCGLSVVTTPLIWLFYMVAAAQNANDHDPEAT
ncbi:MAG: hypothetical protein KC656_33505 [Myxococcales bacterium]|nr:hypothetical protein [Myxococcales bacterium]